jgi:adenylyl-sulfate kinase
MGKPRGFTLWFTGLPSSGKSTLADLVAQELRRRDYEVEVLDGDHIRRHLGRDLGFSRKDRDENVRRVGFVCNLLAKHGTIAIAALISPYRATRQEVRAQSAQFVEVYVEASVEACMKRDVKGLYKQALGGKLSNFTGVNDPYEPPHHAEIEINTEHESPSVCAARIVVCLEQLGLVCSSGASEQSESPTIMLQSEKSR